MQLVRQRVGRTVNSLTSPTGTGWSIMCSGSSSVSFMMKGPSWIGMYLRCMHDQEISRTMSHGLAKVCGGCCEYMCIWRACDMKVRGACDVSMQDMSCSHGCVSVSKTFPTAAWLTL